MPELTVGGIMLVPLIVAIIEFLKKYGLPKDKAPLANGILNVVAFAVMLYVRANPEVTDVVVTALQVLMIFLSAMGFYEWQVKPRKTRQ